MAETAKEDSEIRVIVAPLASGRVLLPGSVVAEVVPQQQPEPLPDTPDWMLGEMSWNGWQVPVISYAGIIDEAVDDPLSDKTRILIFKTLSETAPVPFVGMLIQGLPKLARLTKDSLEEPANQDCPKGVFQKVLLDGREAVIPDLDAITLMIETAAYAP
jgi:chemosensory pili system protein ChpC